MWAERLAPPLIVEPWTIIYCLIGVTVVSLVLDQTVFTARFRALNSDPLVAESFGMNVRASKLGAWALGGAITGLGGCLYSLSVGSIVPDDFGFNRILLVLLAVLLGGAYSAFGSLIGAAIVILLPEVLRNFGVDSSLIYGPVLTLLVLLRPEGLISGFSLVRAIFPQLKRPLPGSDEELTEPTPIRRPELSPIVLAIKDVSLAFGGVKALDHVSFEVPRGKLVSLIGPNGAGKTTLVNVVTGALAPDSGAVEFNGVSVLGKTPHARARLGLSRTFQNPRLLHGLGFLPNATIRQWGPRGGNARSVDLPTANRLRRLGMADLRYRKIAGLNLAEQRKLEIVRALQGDPSLLILDEPTAGMNHVEAQQLIDDIVALRAQNPDSTILLIEHNMNIVMNVSDQVICLCFGEVIATGTPTEIRQDQLVVEAYLGGAA